MCFTSLFLTTASLCAKLKSEPCAHAKDGGVGGGGEHVFRIKLCWHSMRGQPIILIPSQFAYSIYLSPGILSDNKNIPAYYTPCMSFPIQRIHFILISYNSVGTTTANLSFCILYTTRICS